MRTNYTDRFGIKEGCICKLLLMMRLTTILLIAMMMQVSARGLAQSMSFTKEKATYKEVFDQVRRQLGYNVVWPAKKFDAGRQVNVNIHNSSLEKVLEQVLDEREVSYTIRKKTVILNVKEKSVIEKIVDKFSAIEVKGKVVDEVGKGLAGATVKVKNGSQNTVTGSEGEFSLKDVPETATLVISYLGYEAKEIAVSANMGIIRLEMATSNLNEVVISKGYYNTTRELNTGSVSKISAIDIAKQPVTDPLAAISGRMPGVYIQQTTGVPGGDFKIQIRGRNSLRNEGNEPLYVIDGVPFSMEKTFSGNLSSAVFSLTTESGASPLASINPSDIENIEILKDADATAIYGSRGANGVVLITTKKGKPGKTLLDLNIYSGFGKAPSVKLLNTEQFLALRRDAFANDGITPSAIPNSPGYAPELTIWDNGRYTDWQKELVGGTANTTSVQGSISGGSENTQYLFDIGFRQEESVYPGNFGFQQGSFHTTASHRSIDGKFNINSGFTGSRNLNNQVNSNLVTNSRILAPNAPALYTSEGTLNWENSTWSNPLAELQTRYNSVTTNFNGNTLFGYEFIKGLSAKMNLGFNYFQSDENTKYPSTRLDPALSANSARSSSAISSGINQSWIIEPQMNFDRDIAKGHLSIMVGATFQEQKLYRKADSYVGFPSDAFLDNIASANQVFNYELIESLYRYGALFGRLNYNLDNKYIVNFTGRRDGSSRFGPGKQFANFGALGIAWVFSNERFLKERLPFINFGKLRASYGITGNDQIGNYQYLDTYQANTSSQVSSQYQGVSWLSPAKLFNADYAWEVNKKLEAGLELGLFSDRLQLELNYFRNRSSNQLVDYTLPKTTGFSGILANFPAIVQNKGWEASINYKGKASKAFNWMMALNLTIPRNKLLAFPNLESSTYAQYYQVGKPLSLAWLLQSTGVNPQTGLYAFVDVNGDGKISRPGDDSKSMFIGQYFFGGLNSSLSYKSLSLDFLFQFVSQQGYNFWWTSIGLPGSRLNSLAYLAEKSIWKKPGDNSEVQKLVTTNNINGMLALENYRRSDAAVGDASFVRLKNVSLSYQLPKKWTKSSSLRLYFQGQNLWTITGYQGGDPEYQYQFLPPLRMFTTGIQLKL